MRGFRADKYQRLLEWSEDPVLQTYMRDELSVIQRIDNPHKKTFLDLGAGYGRLLEPLASLAGQVIAIEINPAMADELRNRSRNLENVIVIISDFCKFTRSIAGNSISDPVFLLLQNTLGTVEGDETAVLSEIRSSLEMTGGEVVISLFRQPALRTWGMKFYRDLEDMVGEVDPIATDFSCGLFVSKSGYTSKWRTDAEIEAITTYLGGHVADRSVGEAYYIARLRY